MRNLIEVIGPDEATLSKTFECPWCHGHMKLDESFLEQVSNVVTCPYCKNEVCVDGEEDEFGNGFNECAGCIHEGETTCMGGDSSVCKQWENNHDH